MAPCVDIHHRKTRGGTLGCRDPLTPSAKEVHVPRLLEGSCRCGAVHFSVLSHTPYPYQLCYCSICRKTAGGGGFAINLMGDARTLKVRGRKAIRIFRAKIEDEDGHCETSGGQRHFCVRCATALWLFD